MGIDDCRPERTIKIGTSLSSETRAAIIACLRRNRDVFAWSHSDMKGIDPDLMCHRLNVDPRVPARRQKRRPLDPERAQALKDEVDKLLRGRIYSRSEVSCLGFESRTGSEARRKVEKLRRFHQPQRGLSEGQLPGAPN